MNAVHSLQHMLNHLARTIQTLPRLAETGIFDEETLEAVMIFQRDYDLPVTGIVDQITWDTITDLYFANLFQFSPPPPVYVFPSDLETVGESEQAASIRVTQAMFSELAKHISNFQPVGIDGINSGATFRNLQLLQTLSSLPVNGYLDRATWAVLSRLYNTYATRHATRTFPLSG